MGSRQIHVSWLTPSIYHPYLCLYLSIFAVSIGLSLPIFTYLYLSLSIFVYLCPFLSIFIYHDLSLSIFTNLSLAIFTYRYLSLSICAYLYLSNHLYLCLPILSVFVYLYLSLPIIFICLYLSLSWVHFRFGRFGDELLFGAQTCVLYVHFGSRPKWTCKVQHKGFVFLPGVSWW